MKKAINIWSFPSAMPLREKLLLAKKAGFEGFEIDLTPDGPVSLASSPQDLRAVRDLAAGIGLPLIGLATGLYWGANPASEDPKVRASARDILSKQIAAAKELGVDAILVVPGSVGADFIPGFENVPYDRVWDRASEFIRQALGQASDAGVDLCVENVWNKFLLSPLEMAKFVGQFGHPRAAAYFDVGNALATGFPEHWIGILGKSIRRVHWKDYRRAVGSVDGFVELLSGDVNWPAVVRALREIGYSGWVTAEMIPPVPFYRYCPEVLIYNTARAMDAILAL